MSQDFSISLDVAREALTYVSPDCTRWEWVKIGKALHDEFGDEAFEAWDSWSQGGSTYKESDAKSTWKSIARMASGKKPVTIASLIFEAKRGGFTLRRSHQTQRTEAEVSRLRAERDARREAARLAEEEAHRRAAERARAIWAEAEPCRPDHPYLKRKGIQTHCARWTSKWVKEFTDNETGEIRSVTVGNAMLIPIWSAPGRLASLQAVFASDKNRLKRDKDYMTDGAKQGCYCLLGNITADTHIVVVCEGFATGATIHEATGWPVMVAFDAGNLEPVALAVRAKLPGVTIVLASDNDQWTTKRDGTPFNPGVEHAGEAAKAVAGVLAVPKFPSLDGKPTDYNDLAAQSGLAAVKSQLENALNPAAAPAPVEPLPWEDDGESTEPPPASDPPAPPSDTELDRNGYFTILGYQHRKHYVFTHGKRQILEYTVGDLSDSGLIELAPLEWWEENFGDGKGGIIKKAVTEWFVRTAERRGVYDIDRLRGRGAWVDDGRIVYHHGGYLTVDGMPCDVTAIRSRYVYELQKSLPDPSEHALSDDDGRRLVELAGLFRWTKPGSAALLAGWVALAPVCGAIKWRPHVWLTGGAGTGKSTILNDFVHHLQAGTDVFAQGNSSEAGIRQTLKADARPVLYDEAEKNDERERQRVDAILALIRQASTESQAQTLKGTAGGDAMAFHIRSMFCLASIQVGIEHQADRERISILALRPKRDDTNGEATWAKISAELQRIREDKTMPARLLRRSIDTLPKTLKNIETFIRVAARRFGNQRDGDQYGTLLAGCWSLLSGDVATEEQASELIDQYDWSEHLEASDTDESQRALGVLMGLGVRMNGGATLSVYELCSAVAGVSKITTADIADATLQRLGLRAKLKGVEWRLIISNNSEALREMLQGTAYAADLRGLLLRLPGSDRMDNKTERFSGVNSKCISISLRDVLADAGSAHDAPEW